MLITLEEATREQIEAASANLRNPLPVTVYDDIYHLIVALRDLNDPPGQELLEFEDRLLAELNLLRIKELYPAPVGKTFHIMVQCKITTEPGREPYWLYCILNIGRIPTKPRLVTEA